MLNKKPQGREPIHFFETKHHQSSGKVYAVLSFVI